jgi:hypothetical protein
MKIFGYTIKKEKSSLGIVAHTCDPNTQEAEAERL